MCGYGPTDIVPAHTRYNRNIIKGKGTTVKAIRYKMIVTCLAVTAYVLLTGDDARAKFVVSPTRVEAKVPPGKSFEEKFEFTNPGSEPLTVKVHWSDRTKDPLTADWLKLSQNSVEVAPRSTAVVTYTVSIPEGATGEYNAWIVSEQAGGEESNSMASFALRMSVPVYVMVRGTETYDFNIRDISIKNKQPAEINFMLHNTGNVHIRPTGSIIITGVDSPKKYALKFNEINWGVIPNESTEYITRFDDEQQLSDGTYKAQINIQAGAENNMKEWQQEIVFEIKGASGTIIQGLGN